MPDFQTMRYNFTLWRFQFSVTRRLKLWRKLSKLIDNGVPLLVALGNIRGRAAESFGSNSLNVIALDEWIEGIEDGQELNKVVKNWVSLEEVLLLAAGEKSGDMKGAFESVELVLTSKRRITKVVRAALRSPMLHAAAICGFLGYASFSIIPKFELMLQGKAWEGAAAATVALADFTRHWLWLMVLLFIGAVVYVYRQMPSWDGPWRVRFDKIPPFSLYCLMTGSAWVISLSALIKGGVRMEEALEQIKENSDPWLATRTEDCLLGIRAGITLGEALLSSGRQFPDIEVIDDLLIYSGLKDFDKAIYLIGKDLLSDTEEKISLQADFLKALSMAAAGAIMLLLYGGIFAMQQQMQTAFGN